MSATELTEQPQEPLPENPVQVMVEATTVPDAVAVINIEEVRSNTLAAETMESTSVEAASKAGISKQDMQSLQGQYEDAQLMLTSHYYHYLMWTIVAITLIAFVAHVTFVLMNR